MTLRLVLAETPPLPEEEAVLDVLRDELGDLLDQIDLQYLRLRIREAMNVGAKND